MSCTDCGRKGGCDHRKSEMAAVLNDALVRLYPTRRWGERDEIIAFRAGVPPNVGPALAATLAQRLGTLALFRPGNTEEYCDFVYLLCLGRQPSILEVREGIAAPDSSWVEAAAEDGEGGTLDEIYLRVALSSVAPFAAVQQVVMRMQRCASDLVIIEAPGTGVFEPVLLPRFQELVATLAQMEVRHVDFGELTSPPVDFDPADYAERYGGRPTIANYLFFPQPAAVVTTNMVSLGSS